MIVKRFFIFLFISYHGISFSGYTTLLKKYRTLPPSFASEEHHHTKHLTAILLPSLPRKKFSESELNKLNNENIGNQLNWKQPVNFSQFLEKMIPSNPIGQFEKLPIEMIVKIAEHTIECKTFYEAIKGFRSFAYLLKARAEIDLMDPTSEENTKSLRDHFTDIFLQRFPSIHPLILYKNLKINISEELSNKFREPLEQVIDDIAEQHNITQEKIDQWFDDWMIDVTKNLAPDDYYIDRTLRDSIKVRAQIPLLAFLKNKKISQTLAQNMLAVAINNLNIEAIRLCLAAGANPNTFYKSKYVGYPTPLIIIVIDSYRYPGFYSESTNESIHQQETIEALKLLLGAGIDPNQIDHYNSYPLRHAIERRNTKIVKLLLEAGANPNRKKYLNHAIRSSAFGLSNNTEIEIVKYLLEFGADPNTLNGEGELPLLLAIQKGNTEVVKLLLEAGANPNQPETLVHSITPTILLPLAFAIKKGHIEIIKLLLKYGADPYLTNSENNNAFEQSIGNKEIIALLKPYKHKLSIFQTILCFLGIHKNIKL